MNIYQAVFSLSIPVCTEYLLQTGTAWITLEMLHSQTQLFCLITQEIKAKLRN